MERGARHRHVDNVEKFFEQFGWSSFEFNGGALYHNAWIAGLFVAIGLTGFAVLLATLFNLITDLVGGIRVSVLEEEVVARRSMHPVAKARLWYSRRPRPNLQADRRPSRASAGTDRTRLRCGRVPR